MNLSIRVCCCGSIPTSTSETLSLITRTASATSLMSDEVLPPLRISVHCLVGVQLDLHGRRAVPIQDLACPHLVITEDAARRMWAVMKRVGSGGLGADHHVHCLLDLVRELVLLQVLLHRHG
jgi:hypothetical protein